MTMSSAALVNASDVREYMDGVGATGQWTNSQLGSNIRTATWMLERATGRRIADRTETLRFTTNGEAYLVIPGLRQASSVTLQSSILVADSTYHLIPDVQQTGVATGIQFRAFGSGGSPGWWLSNPEWFDRNLDHPHYPGNRGLSTSLPNDLVIAGAWGYAAGSEPDPLLFAIKVQAAFLALRPHAVLSGARANPDGSISDLSQFPIEVQQTIAEWHVGAWAAGT